MKPDETTNNNETPQTDATDLIRRKLDNLYATEPNAKEELKEVEHMHEKGLSKHQQHMQNLSNSGLSLAEIQTAWHDYYAGLPDKEKHQVWQEFYAQHEQGKETSAATPIAENNEPVVRKDTPLSHNTAALQKRSKRRRPDTSTASDIKKHLLDQVQTKSKVTKNPHVRSMFFGLSMGFLTLFVLLFGFFNERFITPFIRPNANVSATPIIVDPQATGPIGPEPKIIIPKINVEAPVVYDVPTINEKDIQKGLERGAVHYPTTPMPGEKGNAVIFGHSSGNILNKGNYKFVFLLLKSMDKEDTFIIQKDGKRYVYKVYNKFVTLPTDLTVLDRPQDKQSIVTLITCDPPGASTYRLIVQAEQIFPDPNMNAESLIKPANAQQPKELPSNSISLWQKIKNWF